jgi:hypothetical protein
VATAGQCPINRMRVKPVAREVLHFDIPWGITVTVYFTFHGSGAGSIPAKDQCQSPNRPAGMTGRQFGDLPSMIQPPLLGVVKAASAVCPNPDLPDAGCAAELLDAVGVHGRTAAPGPQIAAARAERVRSLDPDIAGVERKGIAAFDAVPLEALVPTLPSPANGGG